MAKSAWYILVFGFVTILLLMVGMTIFLDEFQRGPAGNQVRLSQALHQRFKPEGVMANVVKEGSRTWLSIRYTTRTDSKYDRGFAEKEMAEVGAFALKEYKGEDRASVEEVQIKRVELRGRGCWQGEFETETKLPNPDRGKPNPFSPSNPR